MDKKIDMATKQSLCNDKCNDQCQIDHFALMNIKMDNTKIELDEFAYMLSNKLRERIASIGMPIGDKLTSFDLLEFNNTILIKYQPSQP